MMKDKVIALLQQIRPDIPLDDCLDLIEDGLLDSFDLVNLVTAIDSAFGIAIKGTDIVPENFKNTESLCSLVAKYTPISP